DAADAGATSAAAACCSFAASTGGKVEFAKGQISIPAELHAEMDPTPRTAWGVAHDRRGWPMRALDCVIVAPTSPPAPAVYLVRPGFVQEETILQPQSLAAVRVVP